MPARKILLLAGDYIEDYDVMVPFQMLKMVGHTVHAVCPGKKAGDRIRTAIHDFEGDQTYVERTGHGFTLNATFAKVRPEAYAALVIPGGRAPEYLRMDPKVIAITRHFARTKKPIAALCHGIQVLAAADVIRGRRCTSYPAMKPDVVAAGGRWVTKGLDEAYTDGNLVTATAWPAIAAWMAALLKVLGTEIRHGA